MMNTTKRICELKTGDVFRMGATSPWMTVISRTEVYLFYRYKATEKRTFRVGARSKKIVEGSGVAGKGD